MSPTHLQEALAPELRPIRLASYTLLTKYLEG